MPSTFTGIDVPVCPGKTPLFLNHCIALEPVPDALKVVVAPGTMVVEEALSTGIAGNGFIATVNVALGLSQPVVLVCVT